MMTSKEVTMYEVSFTTREKDYLEFMGDEIEIPQYILDSDLYWWTSGFCFFSNKNEYILSGKVSKWIEKRLEEKTKE